MTEYNALSYAQQHLVSTTINQGQLVLSIPPYADIICCKLAILATSLGYFLIGEGTWDLEPENVFHSLVAVGSWAGHSIHLALGFFIYKMMIIIIAIHTLQSSWGNEMSWKGFVKGSALQARVVNAPPLTVRDTGYVLNKYFLRLLLSVRSYAKEKLVLQSRVLPLSRAGPIANVVSKSPRPDRMGSLMCLSPSLGESHPDGPRESPSYHMSLLNVKVCKMSNRVKSPGLYLRDGSE